MIITILCVDNLISYFALGLKTRKCTFIDHMKGISILKKLNNSLIKIVFVLVFLYYLVSFNYK